MVAAVAQELAEGFGAFLIIELWPSAEVDTEHKSAAVAAKPRFRLHHGSADRSSATVERLASSLERISIMKQRAVVERVAATKISRPGLPQLLSTEGEG